MDRLFALQVLVSIQLLKLLPQLQYQPAVLSLLVQEIFSTLIAANQAVFGHVKMNQEAISAANALQTVTVG